jgi:gluconate 5-dehydrogenase
VSVLDQFSLAGKVALVTGAGGGLGRAIACAFADAGAAVLANMRRPPGPHYAGDGAAPTPLLFDITDNVGQRDRRGLAEFKLQDIRDLLETNLVAPLQITRRAAALMIDGGRGGRIINVGSILATVGMANDAVYSSTKGAIEAVTRALAAELGEHDITVNSLSPGPFITEMNQAVADSGAFDSWLTQRSALGRWALPSEITGAAIFLASDASSFVTGHTLVIDGGIQSHYGRPAGLAARKAGPQRQR